MSAFRSRLPHALLLGLLCAADTLRAQIIRGRASSDGAPLADVLVIVSDTAGAKMAESLVDESGRYAIGLRGPGRYVLRAQRIGFNTMTSAPFSVHTGESVVRDLVMTVHPFSLNSIVINAGNRCVVRPSEGEAAARVWD
ncbi:MAG: carboxypeptidase-like regulatory domain-containing protein, partial [Gemmatimonadota bacterium]|nr:carboxypeptidase-like regulatory domain-containing protein [Gemmatimonadota bacterium]